MSVRTRYRIEASVSSTTAEEKDLGNLKMEQACDSQADGGSRKNVIVVAATDVDVTPRQLATTRMLVIRTAAKNPNDTPATINLKKNSALGEVWAIVPLSGTREGYFVTTTDSVTALYVSNPGTVDMEVTVMAAGD